MNCLSRFIAGSFQLTNSYNMIRLGTSCCINNLTFQHIITNRNYILTVSNTIRTKGNRILSIAPCYHPCISANSNRVRTKRFASYANSGRIRSCCKRVLSNCYACSTSLSSNNT